MKKFVSRREILGLIAKAGTSGAVLQASNALGIVPDSYVDIPKIPRVDCGAWWVNRPHPLCPLRTLNPIPPCSLRCGFKPKIWVIIESAPEMVANKMDMIGFVLRL